MRSLEERMGRITEPKYLALCLVGIVIAGVLGIAVGWLAKSAGIAWHLELSGAILVGGVAFSAQLAKGRVRSEPMRTAVLVSAALLFGVVAFHWIRTLA